MPCRAIQLVGKENIFFWTITNRMAPPAVFLLPLFLLYTQVFASATGSSTTPGSG